MLPQKKIISSWMKWNAIVLSAVAVLWLVPGPPSRRRWIPAFAAHLPAISASGADWRGQLAPGPGPLRAVTLACLLLLWPKMAVGVGLRSGFWTLRRGRRARELFAFCCFQTGFYSVPRVLFFLPCAHPIKAFWQYLDHFPLNPLQMFPE